MSAFWSLWWGWCILALVLAMVEMLVPGFIFLGFALGALGVGVVLLAGLTPGLAPLALLFAAFSLVAWLLLRRIFRLPQGQVKTFEHDIND